ncbi:MAG: ATP-binding protein, partial [Tannerellaceae bacterium]|nr:ATP-binding protein [Tannerellaceae bacterium]
LFRTIFLLLVSNFWGAVQLLLGLLNLVRNALQAIEGKENGWVKVIAEKQRSAAVIRIIDNGTGIPRELQTVIFTPFYSTKKGGKRYRP